MPFRIAPLDYFCCGLLDGWTSFRDGSGNHGILWYHRLLMDGTLLRYPRLLMDGTSNSEHTHASRVVGAVDGLAEL